MNNKNIGALPALIGYIVLCAIIYFMIYLFGTTEVNYHTDDSIEVTAIVYDYKLTSSYTLNGEGVMKYTVYYKYNCDGNEYKYVKKYKVSSLSDIPTELDLYVNSSDHSVNLKKEFPKNFHFIFFFTTGAILTFFISIGILIIISLKQKGLTLDDYYNSEPNDNKVPKKITDDSYTSYRDDLFEYVHSKDNKKVSKDDPFNNDDCKYNIDKDDPFADFYKKGK